ncbi:hypothetical protein [Pseudomonas savastanoi]|uniref:hypothetical protein n=1 Tax=Pseudomonas savastanoi TaxID=29438 RepID=UPI000575EB94|nr:hypothetical protein [Pseudomonas savastanoi]
MSNSNFEISWNAPIVPCKSLAGIPLHINAELVECSLAKYVIDRNKHLYQFENSPILQSKKFELDSSGDGGYEFFLFDECVVDLNNRALPALSIVIKNKKVFVIKVYNFSFPGDSAEEFIYKGKLPGGLALGSKISELIPFTYLDFDEELEWFYTDRNYGEVEIGGWGVPLEEQPEQIINSICIIPAASAQTADC